MYSKLTDEICPILESHYTGRSRQISAAVVHYTATIVREADQVVAFWEQNNPYTSANYIIDVSGKITGVVPEEYRPYTTGSYGLGARDIDDRAITIECSCDNTDNSTYTVSGNTIGALCRLLADIGKRYNILWSFTGNESGTIHAHRWYEATPCPGDYLYDKLPIIAAMSNYFMRETDPILEQRIDEMDMMLEDHEMLLRKHTYPIYNKIEDFPEWARSDMQFLIDIGSLEGTDVGLQCSQDLLRVFCVISRTVQNLPEIVKGLTK